MQATQTNGTEPISSGFVPCGRRLDTPWHCIWTKPSQEGLADHSLRSDGFPTFFPMHLATLANRQQRIEFLFPRYGFFQPDPNDQWVRALYVKGVASILRTGSGLPRVVPDAAIDRLMAQCAANGCIYPPAIPEFKVNDAARVISGPFAEWTGICTKSAKDRIWLLMEVMGRPQEIAFARTVLEPA